jgi:hypothetical protein
LREARVSELLDLGYEIRRSLTPMIDTAASGNRVLVVVKSVSQVDVGILHTPGIVASMASPLPWLEIALQPQRQQEPRRALVGLF